VESSPQLSKAGDQLYVGCNDGSIYAILTADGKLAWKVDTDKETEIGGAVYVANDNSIIIGAGSKLLGIRKDVKVKSPGKGRSKIK